MNIDINAYAIHTLKFIMYSPNNLYTAELIVTLTLGNEDEAGVFTPAVFGNTELTDKLELRGQALIDFLSNSLGETETLLDFSYGDVDTYLKNYLCQKYNLESLKSANFPGID